MKAPTDKSNDIIQIILTRRCDLACSNCTQILGSRTDTPNMQPEVFRKALRSVKGWKGVIGMFGGNPCAHPQFEELMAILEEEVPNQRQRGLWTNNLLEHGRTCRRVFWPHGRFNLNAHGIKEAAEGFDKWLPGKIIEASRSREAWHGSILMAHEDFGIPEAQWVEMREKCDINLHWSSAIAERDGEPYVYFCEVGASLDGVRGVNNGILAEPGWWRWKMDRFQDQVKNCCDAGCGVPLKLKGQLDSAETDDVSRSWVQFVTAKHRRVPRHVVHETLPDGEKPHELTDYMRIRENA